jgi:hypothetical protein
MPKQEDDRLAQLGLAFGRRREVRGAVVRVCLTDAERERIAEVAREMGLSLSTYCRRVLLDRPLPPRRAVRPIPEINQQACVELSRIGTNINQLAERANSGHFPERRLIVNALELLARAVADVKAHLIGIGEVTATAGEEP